MLRNSNICKRNMLITNLKTQRELELGTQHNKEIMKLFSLSLSEGFDITKFDNSENAFDRQVLSELYQIGIVKPVTRVEDTYNEDPLSTRYMLNPYIAYSLYTFLINDGKFIFTDEAKENSIHPKIFGNISYIKLWEIDEQVPVLERCGAEYGKDIEIVKGIMENHFKTKMIFKIVNV